MARILSKEQEKSVMNAIKEAENNTSGEIHVHLEDRCKDGDPVRRAIEMFGELHMHETELRNGVIVYVAIKDHKIAVWGDEGIHTKVGQDFWDDTLSLMQRYFGAGDFESGLREAILMIGDKLKENFPYQSDDENELSDDISYGDSDA
jgi:uncharacterized membrane protein